MAEILLTLVLGSEILAAGYGLGRWTARMEQPADQRHLSDRVYYPKRGGKADIQVLVRRQGHPRGKYGPPPDG